MDKKKWGASRVRCEEGRIKEKEQNKRKDSQECCEERKEIKRQRNKGNAFHMKAYCFHLESERRRSIGELRERNRDRESWDQERGRWSEIERTRERVELRERSPREGKRPRGAIVEWVTYAWGWVTLWVKEQPQRKMTSSDFIGLVLLGWIFC